jgi:cation transport ATPase
LHSADSLLRVLRLKALIVTGDSAEEDHRVPAQVVIDDIHVEVPTDAKQRQLRSIMRMAILLFSSGIGSTI